jgi:2',3'-cyclic-nucleotide 2'-phosphodiesterase (5'-nucleotidase family)
MKSRSTLALAVLLLLAGYGWSSSTPATPRSVTLFYSGYVQGGYAPCGCPVQPSGGLARRAGFMRHFRQKTGAYELQIDLGNYFSEPGPAADAVNKLMLQSLDALPIRVMNLGAQDLYYWKELSAHVASKPATTQVISSNLLPKDSGAPAPARYAIVEVPAARIGLKEPLRIGFVGLCDPASVKPNSKFTASDPAQALAVVKPELMKRGADFVVVLADLPRDAAKRLPLAHPEVLSVLVAEKQFVTYRPEQVNNAVILSSTERGRFLGKLEMELDGSGNVVVFRPNVVELVSGVPEDPTFLALEKRLTARLPANQ